MSLLSGASPLTNSVACSCAPFFHVDSWIGMSSIFTVNVILLLRTWAIWGKSRLVLGCLATLLTVRTFGLCGAFNRHTTAICSSVRLLKVVLPFTLISVCILPCLHTEAHSPLCSSRPKSVHCMTQSGQVSYHPCRLSCTRKRSSMCDQFRKNGCAIRNLD